MPSTTCAEGPASVCLGPFCVEYRVGAEGRADEYQLRHRVFVQERGWVTAPADAVLEQDEFDEFCCAFLLRDTASGDAAGCQRFILPERLPAGLITNVERFADGLSVDFPALTPRSWVEVSRSTIAPAYRWGSSSTSMPALVGIKYASVALAVALQRQTLFSFSDVRTARLTRRIGICLGRIGEPVAFHGYRAPFRMDVAQVLRSVPDAMAASLHDLVAAARLALASAGWR
jgi:N-acyl amino acid synthase of PEP-CTERM/exosortase system